MDERERTETLSMPAGGVRLEGDLIVPQGAYGLVIFAHGSGSSRLSTRNRLVAQSLRSRGLCTLLFDLLTADEERRDAIDPRLRFDVPMLARRLGDVTDWVRHRGVAEGLGLGYFGASTGAAVALIAASERPDAIAAVVSRGGRPDLAAEVLDRVHAPTLLVAGSADPIVLALNRSALDRLAGPKELAIVRGASHLFEEPGALAHVARLAGEWFSLYLLRAATTARAGHGP